MSYTVDLHTHSAYSRGTSKKLTFNNLATWARFKGIDVLATGDFTHPSWFTEIKEQLKEEESGLLEYGDIKFILGTEINCSAEQNGKKHRTHILVFAPTIDLAFRVTKAFDQYGRLERDGRPTLRMTPKALLKLVLDIDQRCFIIPAHLWTPYFGLYGSKSGYDSLEECFEEMTGYVYGIETGLSSDPAMNWAVPSLDHVSLMSFSDAHSLQNLGREATVLPGIPSYQGILDAVKFERIECTIEFFPEEGKYHYSGHRKCGTRMSPGEVTEFGDLCNVCGKRITLGVANRIKELSTSLKPATIGLDGMVRNIHGRPPFRMLVSLRKIVSEALGFGIETKTVNHFYMHLISELGNELEILTNVKVKEIENIVGDKIAEGIERVRLGRVEITPGFDGIYGSVKIWPMGK